MKIVYDIHTGAIMFTCMNVNQEPQTIDIEVPDGKILEKIDVSQKTAKPIFADKPVMLDTTAILAEIAELKKELEQTQIGLTEALEMVAPIVAE